MKARLLVLPLVIAAILSVVAIPIAAEWTYDLEVKLTYAPYTFKFEKGYVTVTTFDGSSTAYVRVFDTNLSEVLSCSVTVNGAPTAHAYGDGLIALTAASGASNEDIFFINATDCSIIGNYSFAPAGEGYVQTMGLVIVDGYIYQLMYDSNLTTHFVQIYNSTADIVNSYDVGASALLSDVVNSDYLIFWNGTSYINITDGTAGDLVTVDIIELGLSDLAYARGWYDPNESAVYIAFANSTGTYLVKHIIGTGTEWIVTLESGVTMAITYVGPATQGIYVVTSENYGYRVIDTSTIKKEYIPANAFGHTLGSEYLFSIDPDNYIIYRWLLETVTVTETQTVTQTVTETTTQTVTETQVVYETETETTTVTSTVPGPYTSTDLVIVGLICLLLGAAVAYLARR